MVTRANQLGAGGAGVAPALLDALIAALNAGVTPLTRELGSLGTGDLPGLAEIALALLGEGKVWRDGELVDAPAPAEPIRLGLRDALGFMSSNAVTAGHAALLAVDARALHERWLEVAALSFEALDADPVVLDARVQAGRGARGQTAVAARMRELLAGAPFDPHAPDRLVQDPYAFRVLPQVDGVANDALSALDDVVSRELNARPENALIHEGRAFPTGNFHAAELGAALDGLRAAFAHSSSLIAGRVSAILDPRMSGLNPFLAHDPGPDSGVMMLEYTAHAAAAEARSTGGADGGPERVGIARGGVAREPRRDGGGPHGRAAPGDDRARRDRVGGHGPGAPRQGASSHRRRRPGAVRRRRGGAARRSRGPRVRRGRRGRARAAGLTVRAVASTQDLETGKGP